MRYFKMYEISEEEFCDQTNLDIDDDYAEFRISGNGYVYIAANETVTKNMNIPLLMFDKEV